MKIAVIGGGVAGIYSAYVLSKEHEVSLFESNPYLGGHTNTIEVQSNNKTQAIDTGFIVFNTKNYPYFCEFLEHLGIESQNSDMSFGFYNPHLPFYYSSLGFKGLFSQKRNLINLKFLNMLTEIDRFNKAGLQALEEKSLTGKTLKDFILDQQFSNYFISHYLLPMGAAIWSCSYKEIALFPAESFLQFWKNHTMLTVGQRPTWRTVKGGSYSYVNAFKEKFKGKLFLNTPISGIKRSSNIVTISHKNGTEIFDAVILATHADTTLKLLEDPSKDEQRLFSKWSYSNNKTILHTDTSLLPPKKEAWASWNYLYDPNHKDSVSVTYYMNKLQNLNDPTPYLVTLNSIQSIREEHIIKTIHYTHPIYTFDSMATQEPISKLSGTNRTYYCGSYLGYGFHEDAVRSAVEVARKFNLKLKQ